MRHAPDTLPRTRFGFGRQLLLSTALAASLVLLSQPATARPAQKAHESTAANRGSARVVPARSTATNAQNLHRAKFIRQAAAAPAPRRNAGSKLTKTAKVRYVAGPASIGGVTALQCVPYARAVSGIAITGNAVTWWDQAAGVYERGHRPEPGAVLNFRANSNMRLGHVAVVRRVVNNRQIEIDHANWTWSGKGNITRGVQVIDVSGRNDWSAVRVELGQSSGNFGAIYATYGFIYDRPDRGMMVANTPAQQGTRHVRYDEVAEAPDRSLR
ncbi:CHAP domain-containing protein [Rhodovastum atsumiense]|uniref:CHAP domain-containing protein n=1 Tax=Rhodovastum atsumiense TaxID=504468 RepID=A0A5M6IT61_9PROT|nr:CHAP domain-containing protein [Rhodovastum atsumiense]KAA5611401.1 CHAP domain-containing protein [Rhodovastum atsumiense]CAH2603584.1 CHAP domain-containing protein [Rhodovastum atsumiense]